MEKKDDQGATALNIACRYGHFEIIKLLVESGASVDTDTHDGFSLPMFPSCNGRADIHLSGSTALARACIQGHFDVVNALIGKGASIQTADKSGKTPPLHSALRGYAHITKLLLENGANVDEQCHDGFTALCCASFDGHLEIVDLLIQKKTDINMASNVNMTPLYFASWRGHLAVVKALVSAGADVDVQTSDGVTALATAFKNGHLGIVQILIANGASIDFKARAFIDKGDLNGLALLGRASKNDQLNIVKGFVNHGASIDLANYDGVTLLVASSLRGYSDIVEVLLKEKVDLHCTFFAGHVEIAIRLVQYGAVVDSKNEFGHTAHMLASSNESINTASFLLEHGASIDLVDADGFGAVMNASMLGHAKLWHYR
ncbi:hypothetical protein PHMEG_00033944 [Phytophthora megakarya]|uniref:Uncharacterized protein n=1 Tax=Phytophthora megakarya TaxID=4795 RepID=A0A225USK6_9STRA|nr:hypothetical protein PHMEG_00033944 [Phytophthora megakarya]